MSEGFSPATAPVAFAVATALIRHAARGTSPPLSARLEEEWLADLAAQPSSLAGLRLALGCCWATVVIARDQRSAGAALATSASIKALPLDPLWSRVMARLSFLWIAVAAVAVSALVLFIADQTAAFVLRLFSPGTPLPLPAVTFLADYGLWISIGVGVGVSIQSGMQATRRARADGRLPALRTTAGPSLPARHPLRRPGFIAGGAVMLALCALLFTRSLYFALTPELHFPGNMRMFLALFCALFGVSLLLILYGIYRFMRRQDGAGPSPGQRR